MKMLPTLVLRSPLLVVFFGAFVVFAPIMNVGAAALPGGGHEMPRDSLWSVHADGTSSVQETIQRFKKRGLCWIRAVDTISRSCSSFLGQDTLRSAIAVSFLRCHLQQSGKQLPSGCQRQEEILTSDGPFDSPTDRDDVNMDGSHVELDNATLECTKALDDATFQLYSSFKIHSDQLCFYYQTELRDLHVHESIALLRSISENTAITVHGIDEDAELLQSRVADISDKQEYVIEAQRLLGLSMTRLTKAGEEIVNEMTRSFEHISTVSRDIYSQVEDSAKTHAAILDTQVDLISGQEKLKIHVGELFQTLHEQADMISQDVKESLRSAKLLQAMQQRLRNGMDDIRETQHEFSVHQEKLTNVTTHMFHQLDSKGDEINNKLNKSLEQEDLLLHRQGQAIDQVAAYAEKHQEAIEKAHSAVEGISDTSTRILHNMRENEVKFEALGDAVDKVLNAQSWLLGEFLDIRFVVFYSVVLGIATLISSARYTRDSRWQMYLVTICAMIGEQLWTAHFVSAHHDNAETTFYSDLWLLRKTVGAILCALWIRSVLTFKDYKRINNSILQDISQKTKALARELQEMKSSNLCSRCSGLERVSQSESGGSSSDSETDSDHYESERLLSDGRGYDSGEESECWCRRDAAFMSLGTDYRSGSDDDFTYTSGEEYESSEWETNCSDMELSHEREKHALSENRDSQSDPLSDEEYLPDGETAAISTLDNSFDSQRPLSPSRAMEHSDAVVSRPSMESGQLHLSSRDADGVGVEAGHSDTRIRRYNPFYTLRPSPQNTSTVVDVESKIDTLAVTADETLAEFEEAVVRSHYRWSHFTHE
eukprot:GFYU01002415.1.p1 GENE.GFYU01002415.1~~GFYU01002415.1.p1  ORF type:complete len:825 (-),score=120.78 GFYU01002415.1:24-2498(-)